jgi:hypothetical protein
LYSDGRIKIIICGQSALRPVPSVTCGQIKDAMMASLWNGTRPLFWPHTAGPPAHV